MSTPRPQPGIVEIGEILRDAVAAHRAGDLAAAEQGYRTMLDAAPGHFDVLNLLGVLCGQTARPAESVRHLRRAAALRPRDAEVRKNLALACELSGDLDEAASHYGRALALNPRLAAAQFGLGYCHERAGRDDEAVACYRRTIALAPEHARAHNNLGNLLAQSDPASAEAMLRRAIALAPAYPEPLNNLGALLLRGGAAAAAADVLEQAVALRPGYADAMANLGSALRMLGRTEAALAMLRAAAAADPTAIQSRWVLANALAEGHQGEAAAAVLREALALDGANPQTQLRLGQLLHQLGRFEEAAALFAPLCDAGAHRGMANFGLALTRRFGAADRARVDAMRALAKDATLPAEQRTALLFALGKACDDLGDRAAAMRHYDAGNALQRADLPRFDRVAHVAFVDRLIATFTPDLFRDRRDWAGASDRPLFIVGMMRSGTTLLEQMLAAHPAVAAGGELPFWAIEGGHGAALPGDGAAAAALLAGYDAVLARVSPDAPHVTDKLPHNVYALGLIHMLLPHARILHCRRDAADIGLSIYRTLFAARHEFAYEQGDIVVLLRNYERLAAHWRAVLPPACMLEVQYETMVAAPEATLRAVLGFCGLPWDACCLDHTAHPRMIRTASAWQARQPVHGGATGTARRYAPWLGELAALLGDGGTAQGSPTAATAAG